jgi:predicted metalloprotease
MRARQAAVALVLLAGCSTGTAGTPHAAAPAPATSPSRDTPLSCAAPGTKAVVACLASSLTRFWTAELDRPVVLHTVLDPIRAQVPAQCRAALRLDTAFSCPVDDVVYLTARFVVRLRTSGPADQAWLRIASTVGHEMGHIVQFAVHEPLVTGNHRPRWAQSRRIEQQADCLDGVWAANVGIDDARFATATRVVLLAVDNRWERRSHGTPAQRLAALRRGQRARTPAACGLQLTPH